MMTPEEPFYEIELSRGMRAKVSLCDYASLAAFNWHAVQSHPNGKWYAQRTYRVDTRTFAVWMHRYILGLADGDPRWGDHRNGDTLDCRRSNLRIASPSQNNMNRSVNRNSKSGFKGVSWHSEAGKWRARIKLNHREIHLGVFDTPQQAHAAYCEAANKYHGEFARTS